MKISVDSSSARPLIVSVPHGIPDDIEKSKVDILQNRSNKTVKNTLKMHYENVSYSGTDYGESNINKNCYRYGVGIHDPNTGKIKLKMADNIYVLRPQWDEEKYKAITSEEQFTSNYDRKKSLTREFGSSKKKRAIKAAESNSISVENIAGAVAIENILASSNNVQKSELIVAAENTTKKKRKRT